MKPATGDARRIWTAPLLIGAVTLVSLVGALLADGFWDSLAALMLFATLAYATVLGLRPRGRPDRG